MAGIVTAAVGLGPHVAEEGLSGRFDRLYGRSVCGL